MIPSRILKKITGRHDHKIVWPKNFHYSQSDPGFPGLFDPRTFLQSNFLSLAGRSRETISLYPLRTCILGSTDLRDTSVGDPSRETWKCPWETEPAASPVVPLFPQPLGTRGNDSRKTRNNSGIYQGSPTGKYEVMFSNVWMAEVRALRGLGRPGPFSDAGSSVLTLPSLRHPRLRSQSLIGSGT